ncbi:MULTISPECIES: hypothetical protein [Amylolactobacillus]|nr:MULTISPECIES: hypothetical protein [Amylolactobacillus]GED80868.1 hypothetical protein LAM01_13410 [Amylolactobacillus amylophilus]
MDIKIEKSNKFGSSIKTTKNIGVSISEAKTAVMNDESILKALKKLSTK